MKNSQTHKELHDYLTSVETCFGLEDAIKYKKCEFMTGLEKILYIFVTEKTMLVKHLNY